MKCFRLVDISPPPIKKGGDFDSINWVGQNKQLPEETIRKSTTFSPSNMMQEDI